MACDLQMTTDGVLKSKCKTKIFKFASGKDHFCPEPFLAGFAGNAMDIMTVVDFYHNPELYDRAPKTKNFSGLILTQSGRIFIFYDSPGNWLTVDSKYHSIGSGSLTALGAMHMGATPKQAVQAAMKVDPLTGMGTKVIKL